ncbi:hypothetical protein IGI04_013203 [Brassica rapa subsp. trilocularis]|uniref:F-box domain-containing protein n=1 Tax=Brassica rapa subsp. trilocularis TaxID=1813537 RepID=A0ABQ7NBF4_BRACM|nr:hypothetical protein IGI04_013203 [Brassica rapa subsp. trilocularis]
MGFVVLMPLESRFTDHTSFVEERHISLSAKQNWVRSSDCSFLVLTDQFKKKSFNSGDVNECKLMEAKIRKQKLDFVKPALGLSLLYVLCSMNRAHPLSTLEELPQDIQSDIISRVAQSLRTTTRHVMQSCQLLAKEAKDNRIYKNMTIKLLSIHPVASLTRYNDLMSRSFFS